jgi:hypothetical protein
MQRLVRALLVSALAVMLVLGGAQVALAATDGTFNYTVTGGAATVDLYIGSGGNVVIPATLGGAPVTRIGNQAFQNKLTVTGVTIPGTVTSLGMASFGNTGLTSVSIPNSVAVIEVFAFQANASLTRVNIGSGVTSIQPFAFASCPNLTAANFMGNAPAMAVQVFGPAPGPVGFKVYFINGKTGFVAPPGPWLGYTTAYYVSTPASSPWSLALASVAALGFAVVVRRRMAVAR